MATYILPNKIAYGFECHLEPCQWGEFICNDKLPTIRFTIRNRMIANKFKKYCERNEFDIPLAPVKHLTEPLSKCWV